LRASSGSGVTAAYVLPLVDRLAGATPTNATGVEGPRALVLTASAERASEVAAMIARHAGATGLRARAVAPAWPRVASDVVVATPDAALRSVADSSLKLEAVETLVIDDAAALLALEGADPLETLLVTVPADAQRVITVSGMTRDVERFVQAHARRAMEIPPRPADPLAVPAPPDRGTLSYRVVSDHGKRDAIAELLARSAGGERTVITRTAADARALGEALAARGFDVAGHGREGSITVLAALDAPRVTFAYDVPAEAQIMERMEADGVVLVTSRELQHLRALAAETGFRLQAFAHKPRRGAVTSFRERIRRALREEDIEAQLLVLEPLFEESSAAEVAAALSALLRARAPDAQPQAAPSSRADTAGTPAAFVRLFFGIGQRDNVRPSDLLGAITGEAGVKGEQVGRIDIRDSFSTVEVEAGIADGIIRALNGTTMRGRSLRVDFDRKRTTPSGGSTAPRRPRGTGIRHDQERR
jgi:ATP-dependent RNA helicase DeaD